MSIWSLGLMGLGLSADAFAAALVRGLKMRTLNYRYAVYIALCFALFQAAMPLLGWLLASQFSRVLAPVDHWIAFLLLAGIGGKMVWEAMAGGADDEGEHDDDSFDFRRVLLLGLATSIDAAAVGVSLAMLDVSIVQAMVIVGLITLAMSLVAVMIGHRVGVKYRRPAELIGGLVLIGIGGRILTEHLQLFG